MEEKKQWCKIHPNSIWGVDQFGHYYPQCLNGKRLNEQCETGSNEEEKDEGNN